MAEYSVATTNRFALGCDEDEDLFELLAKKQEEKKQKDELAAEQAAAAKAKAASSKGKNDRRSAKTHVKRVAKTNDQTNTQPQQTTYSRNDENRPPRFARQNREGGNDNFEKPPQDSDRERKFGGRGGRGGGMRGGYAGNRPRREFDRQSGSQKTGVKAVEKKEGGGSHNWGDSIDSQLQSTEDQKNTTTDQIENGVDADLTENTETEGGETEPVVQQPKEMTLDEWKASQMKTKTEFKVRKANEGVDAKQWKGTVALQRKKKGDHSDEEYEEYSDDEEVIDETKANLEKLKIEITFGDSGRNSGPSGRGKFSNRGGPRRDFKSRGGRGGGFGGNQGGNKGKHLVPQVNNENDFPTLGSR